MITSQRLHSLRLIPFICFLLFTNFAIGQFKVKDIKRGDTKIPKADIVLTIGDDTYPPRTITRSTKDINNKATIRVLDDGITLILTTSNGNDLSISGSNNIVEVDITKEREEYKLINGKKSENVIIDVIKEFTGSVIATGVKKRFTAATDGTIFSLSLDNDNLDIVLKEGSLNVSHLIKKEISDENVIGNNNKRALFIRETRRLTVKDSVYPNMDNNQPLLSSDKEIKKFLHKPFKEQKTTLINTGSFSKSAIRYLEKETSIDKAILSFEDAIDNGELDIDLIIQSALLFADAYFYNGDLEKSRAWVEIGIHFGEILYDTKEKKLNARLNENIDESDYKEINSAITKSYKYDMLTANEFRAWGYDIKLKLNGCLENSSENPSKYRSNAKKLRDELSKTTN